MTRFIASALRQVTPSISGGQLHLPLSCGPRGNISDRGTVLLSIRGTRRSFATYTALRGNAVVAPLSVFFLSLNFYSAARNLQRGTETVAELLRIMLGNDKKKRP